MIIGILKESGTENRVAMLPGEVTVLKKMGIEVLVELRAGERAFASDDSYIQPVQQLLERKEIISKAEMLLSVNPPLDDDINSFREGQVYVRYLIRLKTASGLKSHG